ncbi:MAG: DUF4145 domain-containing protein [Cellvibrio sp.]
MKVTGGENMIITTLNKTQNRKISLPCVKCLGKTSHIVLVSADVDGTQKDEYDTYYWSDAYQIIQCEGCESKSFRNASSNSEDYYQVSGDEWEYEESETLYPSRIEGRKSLRNESHYLPKNVQRIYLETLSALNNHSPVLAGIGLRVLIEAICKENNADGGNLYSKIDDLVIKKILTPGGSTILHKIRTLGNEAAHEVKPHNEKQLGLAMEVVEHVLNDVYIIPKKVIAEFGE